MFTIGAYYPDPAHRARIRRYKKNRKLFLGLHHDVFQLVQNRLSHRRNELVYISANLPGIICKKSADFLFGESPIFSAGKEDSTPEQLALNRLIEDNDIHITNYESALGNAYRGDSFYKIRYGQNYGGQINAEIDPFRVFIEAQNAEYVFPETLPGDANKILAYHIAYPLLVKYSDGEKGILNVESHYPGVIQYSKWRLNPMVVTADNEITEWIISAEIPDGRKTVETGVSFPLVVHVPNYSTDESWEGIDDLSEHRALFDEINHRISQIANILDKHADPAIAVPAGTMGEDEEGNPIFRVGVDKVFELLGKDDLAPQYITWDGQLQSAFSELEKLIDILLINAEIPSVALGQGDSGTSGSSGLSIKWRMNSLLAKINRKRQYYDKGLKQILYVAQLLEQSRLGTIDYQPTLPKIKFNDGLPDDETEMANVMAIRTAGKQTISQKSAIMWLDSLTEEQADAELKRIQDEAEAAMLADPTAFNTETPAKPGGGGK